MFPVMFVEKLQLLCLQYKNHVLCGMKILYLCIFMSLYRCALYSTFTSNIWVKLLWAEVEREEGGWGY
jgi:hypothetical protein